MSTLADMLGTSSPALPPKKRQSHPKGFEPGVKYQAGVATEVALNLREVPADEKAWRKTIAEQLNITVPESRKLELTDIRLWGPEGAQSSYVKWVITDRLAADKDIEALVKAAKRTVSKTKPPSGERAYVIALGDLQLGKPDGDGPEGTVSRFLHTTKLAVERLKHLRKTQPLGPIYLLHLGDCIEGHVSQGGGASWRTSLTTTEQVRLYRRLLLEQIKTLAPLTDQLVMAGIPGNHDEAHRPLMTYGDSWAIEAVEQVADAMALAGNYGHVTTVVPDRDELTLTLDIAGTIVGMAHGHQFARGDAMKWWAGQSQGRQPIGDADLLIAGHLHHLKIHDQAPRTFMQLPALEAESTWWRHRTGQGGRPGIVTMTVGGGDWSDLQVLA